MGKRPKKKASDQARHFAKRAAERYGEFDIDPDQISHLVRSGLSTPIWKESNTRSHYLVDWNGKQMRVVYDRVRKTVVTALPPLTYPANQSI